MDRSKNSATSNPKNETVELLTAREVTMDSFPYIAELSQNHSSGTGLHDIRFNGKLRYWNDFPMEVRRAFQETKWDDRAVSARLGPEDLNYSEHFCCGAEISTSARYVTHVLNPMTGVAKHLGYNISSGDWSVAGVKLEWPKSMPAIPLEKDKSSIPDYVLLDLLSKEPRVLGEAKHPWGKGPVDLTVERARSGDDVQKAALCKFLGQVSRDMWAAKLKLGFMTSYTWTIFIRREIIDNEWFLFYSDAIHHTTKSKMGTSDRSVSVRECMLYYFKLAAGERSNWSLEHEQQEPIQNWVDIKDKPSRSNAKPSTNFPQQDHRIPSDKSLKPSTQTTGKTTQLAQRFRSSGQGQSKSDSTDAKQAEYKDVGELSIYKDFYKFMLDGTLSMKYQNEWTTDQYNENILYHHAERLRGLFQGSAATPGALQGTDQKGKARVDIDRPATSSPIRDSQGVRHGQSQSRVPSNTLPKTAAPKYTFIGVLPTGWKSYKHKEGDLSVDLPKAQWRKVGSYYYHDEKLLQGKAP